MVEEIYKKGVEEVKKVIQGYKVVTLAVDGWEDNRKLEAIGIVVQGLAPGENPLLQTFDLMAVRTTAPNLHQVLQASTQDLVALGVRVLACVSDNAANMKAALATLTSSDKVIALHCFAHAGIVQSFFSNKKLFHFQENYSQRTLEEFSQMCSPKRINLNNFFGCITILGMQLGMCFCNFFSTTLQIVLFH